MTIHTPARVTRSASMLSGATLLFTAPLALAHHPMGGATPGNFTEGLLSGFGHPLIGIDHFAFLVVAALLAFTLKGRSRYLVPLAFVGATVMGTLYHLTAADLALTETVVALSALLGGVAVLMKRSAPALLLGGLFAGIGIFHGYAYGEAIIGAEQTPLLSYLVGFAAIQYAVIVGGVKAMDVIAARSSRVQTLATRGGGMFATAAGGLFLAMNLA